MPKLTTIQIVELNNLLNEVKGTLQQWATPGSRFYELDAYSFLGSFLPCGRVPQAQDEIAITGVRIGNINQALEIIRNATPDTDSGDGTGDDDSCKALVDAINALNAKLDLTTTINNALTAFLPTIVNAFNPKFETINDGLDQIIDYEIDSIEGINQVKIAINDTRVELREARERLIVIQGANKDNEILQRIEDTRIELREARERLITVEACVCPRIQGGTGGNDDLISRLMIQINEALDSQAILIFDSLYTQMINISESLTTNISNKIDNPVWLPAINTKLDTIINLLNKLDSILDLLNSLNLYIRDKLDKISDDIATLINITNNIDANVFSIRTALNLLSSAVTQLDNSVDAIRILINALNTTANNILNEVRNLNNADNVDVLLQLGQVLALLNALQNDVDRLQPPTLNGTSNYIGCLANSSVNYSGVGFIGLSNQIATISNQLNYLHSELCSTIENNEQVYEGELVSVDCQTPYNIITSSFSGTGISALVQAFEITSQNTLALHQEVCKQKENEPNCFVLVPSDVDEELEIPRQLIIHWRVDNNESLRTVSKWQSTIVYPISNLTWEQHFANLRWIRGNITGRWYLQGSTARIGGYFATEQDALDTLNQLIQLTTLQPKTQLPRITKNSNSFIQTEGIITRPFKIVVTERQNNKFVPILCLKEP